MKVIYFRMWGMPKLPVSLNLSCLPLPAQFPGQLWELGTRSLKKSAQFGWLVSLSLCTEIPRLLLHLEGARCC